MASWLDLFQNKESDLSFNTAWNIEFLSFYSFSDDFLCLKKIKKYYPASIKKRHLYMNLIISIEDFVYKFSGAEKGRKVSTNVIKFIILNSVYDW